MVSLWAHDRTHPNGCSFWSNTSIQIETDMKSSYYVSVFVLGLLISSRLYVYHKVWFSNLKYKYRKLSQYHKLTCQLYFFFFHRLNILYFYQPFWKHVCLLHFFVFVNGQLMIGHYRVMSSFLPTSLIFVGTAIHKSCLMISTNLFRSILRKTNDLRKIFLGMAVRIVHKRKKN